MAEYRVVRLICKHFGFDAHQVDEWVEYGEFWCYAAEAFDAEELQDYRDSILAGGKEAKKKWKWQTKDHAGTRSVATKSKNVGQSIADFATMLTGGPLKKSGDVSQYAKIRGLQKVFQDKEGNLYDENMNKIESDSGLVFVPSEERVH